LLVPAKLVVVLRLRVEREPEDRTERQHEAEAGHPFPTGCDLVAQEDQTDDGGWHRGRRVHGGHGGGRGAPLHGEPEEELANE
jgi:hypothetical protein